MKLATTALLLATVSVLTVPPVAAETTLTQKQKRMVDQLIPLHTRGDSIALLKAAAQITQRAKAEQLEAMDEYLREQDLPPLAELMADTRLKLVFQGHAKHLPKPTQRETLLTIPRIHEIVDTTINDVDAHTIMQNPLPQFDSLHEYEQLLWDVHVLENNMRNALNTAAYGQQMVDFAKRFKTKSMTADQLAIARTDFGEPFAMLQQKSLQIAERKTEVRLDRLQMAGQVLNDSTDFRPRFTAARVVDLDGDLLAAFLEEHKDRQFSRERLNEPDLGRTVADEVAVLREEAGDLVDKSRLFFTGLHWWQRGRYGRGSEGRGMLKSTLAMKSATAAFGLFMPSETPQPTDPYELGSYQVPEIDRRHHYVWMYEYREITSHAGSQTSTLAATRTPSSVTKFNYFW